MFTYRAFDFDRTSNRRSTFRTYERSLHAQKTDAEMYETGKAHAQSNLKINIANWLKHDAEHIAAIVTFHNNPLYIAGYVAHILNKELVCNGLQYPDPDSKNIAVARFKVKGSEIPFYIVYLDQTANNFVQASGRLGNKNKHLAALRSMLSSEGLINNEIIEFYDDDQRNYLDALSLGQIKCHWVSSEIPTFTIKRELENLQKKIKSPY